jgi:hypothetical protein
MRTGVESYIYEAMQSYWGERCKGYEPDCGACEAWAEYDELVAK